MLKLVEDALVIYTDGSLFPKGRRGGYSMVFVHVNEIGEETVVLEESPPGIRQGATGNRMELTACIEALRLAPNVPCFSQVSRVVVRTDSRYVKDYHTVALGVWRTQRWRNRDGRPVANADLWKEFVSAWAKARKPKRIEWIKGHGKGRAKNVHNVRADELARASAQSPLSRREYRSSVRPKAAPGTTKLGSVRIFGQTIVIYVMETERMPAQKEWKYRYQVMSPHSSDYRAIDWIYSKEQMRDGHCYEVQLNDNKRYPQVLTVLRHVDRNEVPITEAIPQSGETN